MAWVLGKRLQLDSIPCGETMDTEGSQATENSQGVDAVTLAGPGGSSGWLEDEITADEFLLSCPGKQSSVAVLFFSPLA